MAAHFRNSRLDFTLNLKKMILRHITVGLIYGIFCIMDISTLELKDSLLPVKVKPAGILPVLSQNPNNRLSRRLDPEKRFFIEDYQPTLLDLKPNTHKEFKYEEDLYDNGQTKVSLVGNFENDENITGNVGAKFEHKIMNLVTLNAEASINGLYRNFDLSYDGGRAKFGLTWSF